MAYNSTSWTTDANTKAGSTGTNTVGGVTLYADFFTHNNESLNWAAGYHHLLTFGNSNFSAPSIIPNLGNGGDPATSFTLSDGSGTRASTLVNCLWYLPDNIYIDSVHAIEGADADATDTTRMHLMSYTYNSGVAGVLGGGTLLAHNSDVTNAGSAKSYLSTFTIDSPSVSSGKVIVATFESDSINSDYTINLKVKYHLI